MSGEVPVYEPMIPSHYPEVDESDLATAGVGLYRVRGWQQNGDMYRPATDDWARGVDQIMMARIDDGPTMLPMGVHRAEIRPDGKRLIMAWVQA
jgi:hypothetical protein